MTKHADIPTGRELDAWIAENICGWVRSDGSPYHADFIIEVPNYYPDGRSRIGYRYAPAYTQDLNAIQEAIKTWLSDEPLNDFDKKCRAMSDAFSFIDKRSGIAAIIAMTATAIDWAQALWLAWHECNKEESGHD